MNSIKSLSTQKLNVANLNPLKNLHCIALVQNIQLNLVLPFVKITKSQPGALFSPSSDHTLAPNRLKSFQ